MFFAVILVWLVLNPVGSCKTVFGAPEAPCWTTFEITENYLPPSYVWKLNKVDNQGDKF
jgi:hypothetical protein